MEKNKFENNELVEHMREWLIKLERLRSNDQSEDVFDGVVDVSLKKEILQKVEKEFDEDFEILLKNIDFDWGMDEDEDIDHEEL